jgi:hypothetical protein
MTKHKYHSMSRSLLLPTLVAFGLGSTSLAAAAEFSSGQLKSKLRDSGLPADIVEKIVAEPKGDKVAIVDDLSADGLVLYTAVAGPDREPMIISANPDVELPMADIPADERRITLSYASTPDSVRLSWNAIPNVNSYQVYRDGELIGTVLGTSYEDEGLEPGSVHDYRVSADALMDPEAVTDPETGEVSYPERRMTYTAHTEALVAPKQEAGLKRAVQMLRDPRPTQQTTTFAYRTFINTATAPGFPCVKWPTNTYFGGDNRGYSSSSDSYRTQMRVTAIWDSRQISSSKQVGATRNYNNNGSLRETKTATDRDMLIMNKSINDRKATFTLDHSATNPFCSNTGGAIRYKITVNLYKSGAWSTSGWRRPVPHHEAYVQKNAGAFKKVFQLKNNGFHCLTGVCGTQGLGFGST